MTTIAKPATKPPDVGALTVEAKNLRTVLEQAALDGSLDLKGKHGEAHQRLDELERVLYTLRRTQAKAEKKS